jgi:hypothetical protein
MSVITAPAQTDGSYKTDEVANNACDGLVGAASRILSHRFCLSVCLSVCGGGEYKLTKKVRLFYLSLFKMLTGLIRLT